MPPPAEMGVPAQQSILVATAHIHWDPEFCDVKLIQVSKKSLNFLNIPKCSALKGFLMWPSLQELHSSRDCSSEFETGLKMAVIFNFYATF